MAEINIEPGKLAKFKVLIGKVKSILDKKFVRDSTRQCCVFHTVKLIVLVYCNVGSTGVCEYLQNEYATAIYNVVGHKATPFFEYLKFSVPYDTKQWIDTAVILSKGQFDRPFDYIAPYTFYSLFWSLMVLAVDDTDKEKHLSTICDFARMLNVSDEEMMDIANVVKYVFQDATYQNPKSEKVAKFFSEVLTMYER